MAASNGLLEEADAYNEIKREVLEDLRDFLVSNIDPGKFYPYMRSKRVLTEDDEEEIDAEKTRKRRAEKFLNFIGKRGGEGFDEFCEAIRRNKTQLFILTKMLDQFELRKESLPGPDSSSEERQMPPLPSNPPAYDDVTNTPSGLHMTSGHSRQENGVPNCGYPVPPPYS